MAPNHKRCNRKQNIHFKSLILMTALLVLLSASLFHCSKSENENQGNTPLKPPKRSLKPVLTVVNLDPAAPTALDFITANPVREDIRGSALIKYQYRWYINGEQVPDSNRKVLKKGSLQKGDEVFCRVTARRGTFESTPLNSKKTTIANAAPVLNLAEVPAFQVPGRFEYTISAYDPDGDDLTYHLLEPQDQGIEIDPRLGRLTWDIDRIPDELQTIPENRSSKPSTAEDESAGSASLEKEANNEPKLATVIKIIFEVRDADGGTVTGEIQLNLAKGTEIPE